MNINSYSDLMEILVSWDNKIVYADEMTDMIAGKLSIDNPYVLKAFKKFYQQAINNSADGLLFHTDKMADRLGQRIINIYLKSNKEITPDDMEYIEDISHKISIEVVDYLLNTLSENLAN